MKSKIITVIPVYNGADFIVQTLQSIANQTLRPDRVIVSDNRSTDKTEQLVKEFKPIRVEWRQNEANLGCFGVIGVPSASTDLEYHFPRLAALDGVDRRLELGQGEAVRDHGSRVERP